MSTHFDTRLMGYRISIMCVAKKLMRTNHVPDDGLICSTVKKEERINGHNLCELI